MGEGVNPNGQPDREISVFLRLPLTIILYEKLLHFFRIRVAPFSLPDVIFFIAPKSDHCLAMSLTCKDAEFKEPLLE